MATFNLPILGVNTLPDTSGNVFFEPLSVKTTNDRYPGLVCIFNDTATRIGLRGAFRVPNNYVGTPKIVVEWSSTATSGNVAWDIDYTAIAAGETLDPSSDQESATVTAAAPTSAWLRKSSSITLTAANLAVDDIVEFTLFRDGADAADTMAAAAVLLSAYFQYADA